MPFQRTRLFYPLSHRFCLAKACQLTLLAIGLAWVFAYHHDDAYITYRYVERFLAGKGLNWTSGPPVEGYTHPAWLAMLIVARSLGVPLAVSARFAGILALLAIPCTLPARHRQNGILFLSCLSLAALCGSISGLETVGFSWAAWSACVVYARPSADPRRKFLLPIILALVALLRPEGMGILFLVSALELFRHGAQTRWGARVRPLLLPFALVIGYQAFRWFYFGGLVSNSALAKLTHEPASTVILRGLDDLFASYPAYAPVLAGALLLAIHHLLTRGRAGAGLAPEDRSLDMVSGLSGLMLLLAMLWVGGDHMVPHGRMLVPVMVLLGGSLNTLGQDAMANGKGLRAALMGTAVLALAAAMLGYREIPREDPACVYGQWTGRFLESHLPPGTVVAVATAGSTAYFAPDLEFIDTLGLNSKAIAMTPVRPPLTRWNSISGHQRGNGPYVLAQRPDVIILGPSIGYLGNDCNYWFLTDYELIRSPAFRAAYSPFLFPIQEHLDLAVLRPELLSTVEQKLYSLGFPAPPAVRAAIDQGGGVLVAFFRNDSSRVAAARRQGIPASGLLLPIAQLRSPPL